jgi:hypothetical protein
VLHGRKLVERSRGDLARRCCESGPLPRAFRSDRVQGHDRPGRQRRRSRRTAGRGRARSILVVHGCCHGAAITAMMGLREILIETNGAISTCQGDSPPDRRKPALFLATGTQCLSKQRPTTGRVAGAWHARHELPASIAAACREVLASWARSGGTRRGSRRGRADEHRTYRDHRGGAGGRRGGFETGRRGRGDPRCAGVRRDRRGDAAARGPGRVRAGAGRALDRPRLPRRTTHPTRCHRRR